MPTQPAAKDCVHQLAELLDLHAGSEDAGRKARDQRLL